MRTSCFIILLFSVLLLLMQPGFCEEPPSWFVPTEEAEEETTEAEETPPSWLVPTEEAEEKDSGKAEAETVTPTREMREILPAVGTDKTAPAWLTATAEADAFLTKEAEAPKPVVATPEAKEKKEIVFSDVPEGHWARKQVYGLIKLGITQGYPDGTFRGNQRITRYETAMFVSRLEKIVDDILFQADESRREKYEEKKKELRDELDKLKAEIEELKKPPEKRPQFGMFLARLRAGNLISQGSAFTSARVGPKFDYRIIAGGKRRLNDKTLIKANFDTMDMGWGGGTGGFAMELFDFEGDIKLNDTYSIKLTAGPGTIVHSEPLDGPIPSDNGLAFVRPKNSISVTADFKSFYLSGGYKALSLTTSGEASASNLNFSIGREFEEDIMYGLKEASLTFDFDFKDRVNQPGEADVFKEKIYMLFVPSYGFEIDGTLGMSSFMGATDSSYYGFGIKLEDIIEEGTTFTFKLHRAGKEYLNYPVDLGEDDYIGVNFFDKLIYSATSEGIADIGFEVIRESGDLRLEAKANVQMTGDYGYGKDYAGTNATFEIGFYKVSKTYSSIGLIYRIYHYPSSPGLTTSDLLGIVGKYEF